MKNVFLFIHADQSIARIVSGYTSISAIKAAGLNTKSDFSEKHESVEAAKLAAKRFDPTCQLKVHIA